MRIDLLGALLAITLVSACGGAAALEDGVVEGCQACHRDALSLATREPAGLQARIAALATGPAGTHPVPIPTLSDADLELLVTKLTRR